MNKTENKLNVIKKNFSDYTKILSDKLNDINLSKLLEATELILKTIKQKKIFMSVEMVALLQLQTTIYAIFLNNCPNIQNLKQK